MIDWNEICENYQCDPLCKVNLYRVKGRGVICGGCDCPVQLISESHAKELELEQEIIKEINQEYEVEIE